MTELSTKHAAFVAAFLRCFNGAQAYLTVYPDSSYEAAVSSASELLTNPNVKAAIKAHIETHVIEANEVLHRLARIARGDMGDFLKIGKGGKWSLDIAKAKALGQMGIIKKITHNVKTGERSVELYDQQAALTQLGKHLGLFDDKLILKVENELQKALYLLEKQLLPDEYVRVLTILSGQYQLEDSHAIDGNCTAAVGADGIETAATRSGNTAHLPAA